MHFNAATILSLLPAFAVATSYLKGGSGSGGQMLMDASNADGGVNACGDSTFVQLTQDVRSQAKVKDCQDMLQKIQKDQEGTYLCCKPSSE
jgi:hypothetical protein